jgi:hypothetical protein
MRRLAFAAAALALFVAAQWLAPPAGKRLSLPGRPLVAALGPLRPIVAELVRLRFDSSRLTERVFGQLDDAWTVLALRPDRPEEFAWFGGYFVIDAPTHVFDPVERRVLVQAGFEILQWGRRLHPDDWHVPHAESIALYHLLQADPARAAADALRARLLDRCEEMVAHAPAPDDPRRGLLRVSVEMWLEAVLKQPGLAAPLAERARLLAQRLLAWPDLAEASRKALTEAIR